MNNQTHTHDARAWKAVSGWRHAVAAAGFLYMSVCGAAEPQEEALAEIVVTAEKHDSTIQNTPISMSALSGAQLEAAGITTVEGLAREVPGLSVRSAGPGQTEYEGRGLASSAGAAPTVGFYLDEVPLSPPSQTEIGKVVIDPDLYDITRIELLRGPQGTLYGSGSMGGTVKIVTNQPKLGTYEATFQGNLSATQGGSGNGGGSFMLNAPFGDVLALRVVGTDTYRSGWIDRIVANPLPPDTTTRGDVLSAPVQSVATKVNTENLYGGRAALLFKPSDDFSVVGTYFYQRMVMGGYDQFDNPPGPDYQAHYAAFNIAEPIADTVRIFSLTATGNVGFADITSATGYWQRHEHQTQDASESVSDAADLYPFVAVPYTEVDITRQFSQELRLASRGNAKLHWVGGLFYSDETSDDIQYSANPAFADLAPDPSMNPTGVVYAGDNQYRLRQYAAFLDGSYNFSDQWKFESGLRWFRYDSSLAVTAYGYLAQSLTPGPAVQSEASNHGFNPRFDLSYSPTRDLTTYLSASKGFRPGGANQQVPQDLCNAGVTPPFSPDSVWDYEIGEKTKLFDGWLTVNSDFFYIKWNGVQQTIVLGCGFNYTANAGNGRSFGPELEVNAKLTKNWSVALSASHTDARITNPSELFAAPSVGVLPSCASASDCTLPVLNVPKNAGSLALIYSTRLPRDYMLTGRLSGTYVGTSTDQAYEYVILPAYTLANARLGLSNDKWSASFFVDNLTNKIVWNSANNTQFQVNIPALTRISTNQPRTFGVQIDYRL